MWEIREVKDDVDFFKLAYQWYLAVPGFLKALQDLRQAQSEEEFLESLKEGRAFRGDEDGVPKVLVHAEYHGPGRYEGHLMCPDTAGPDLIAAVICYARVELMKEPCVIVCHVLRKHRARANMVMRAGFVDSGLRAWQGVYRGHPQEIVYYVAGRS
jgi:hypothetical protein